MWKVEANSIKGFSTLGQSPCDHPQTDNVWIMKRKWTELEAWCNHCAISVKTARPGVGPQTKHCNCKRSHLQTWSEVPITWNGWIPTISTAMKFNQTFSGISSGIGYLCIWSSISAERNPDCSPFYVTDGLKYTKKYCECDSLRSPVRNRMMSWKAKFWLLFSSQKSVWI